MDKFKYWRVVEDGLDPSACAMRRNIYARNTPYHWAHVVSEWLEEQEITV